MSLEFPFYSLFHFIMFPVCKLRSNNLPWAANLRACLPLGGHSHMSVAICVIIEPLKSTFETLF